MIIYLFLKVLSGLHLGFDLSLKLYISNSVKTTLLKLALKIKDISMSVSRLIEIVFNNGILSVDDDGRLFLLLLGVVLILHGFVLDKIFIGVDWQAFDHAPVRVSLS